MALWRDVYSFWFGDYEETGEYLSQRMPFWFVGTGEVDSEIKTKFLSLIELYESNGFPWSDWKASPKSFLSLIILFDQFPRNIFRGEARAYAYDTLSLSLAREFVSRGWVPKLQTFEKMFIFLPFEHSESRQVQKESVAFFKTLRDQSAPAAAPFVKMAIDYAEKHLDVIERFGRYPHRNEVLERDSTSSEREFLDSKEIVF